MAIITTSAVAVGTSATVLYTPKSYPARVTIQNLSGSDMYVGGSGVTTAAGLKIANGAVYIFEGSSVGPVYGIAGAAQTSPADTRVLVEPIR